MLASRLLEEHDMSRTTTTVLRSSDRVPALVLGGGTLMLVAVYVVSLLA